MAPSADVEIEIGGYVLGRMRLRGATEAEVRETVREGVHSPAREGRWSAVKVFLFDATWLGKRYAEKRVRVIFGYRANGDVYVVTVITQYGRWT